VTTPFFRDVVLAVEARHGIERPTTSPVHINHGGKRVRARIIREATRPDARPKRRRRRKRQ
jgi:hypothetical protein